ncbi:IS6 family transposase, partial [Streptomyces sp. NPDC088135]
GPRRHLMTAPGYRTETTTRLAVWDQITGVVGLPAAA